MTRKKDLENHVMDAFRMSPYDAASDGTIQGILANDDRQLSREEIRDVCDDLVEDGVLELAGTKGSSKRYRLTESE